MRSAFGKPVSIKALGFLCLLLVFSADAWAQRTPRARTTPGAVVTSGFFPLQLGNSWTYAFTGFAAQGSVTVKVTNAIDVEGVRYYKIEGYTADPEFVRQDAAGKVFGLSTDPVETGRWFRRANSHDSLWYDLAAPAGTSWESGLALECLGMAGIGLPPPEVHVPGGTFSHLVAVAYHGANCADAGVEEEVFAAGVGLIRRTSLTIGGPRSMVLVSAQVNGKQIGAKGLTVGLMIDQPVYFANLQPPVDAVLPVPVLHAQFKVENTGEQPLTVAIPSGQEFDLVIRNEAGEKVFRWSDGKFFTQALQTIAFSPGERVYAVDVPLGGGGQPLRPGRYTVEAWIATIAPKLYQATLAFEIRHVF